MSLLKRKKLGYKQLIRVLILKIHFNSSKTIPRYYVFSEVVSNVRLYSFQVTKHILKAPINLPDKERPL